MAKEVERKFLVTDNSYKTMSAESYNIAQGYLSRKPEATVRVRTKGAKGFLTVKGKNSGCERNEWEYEIPLSDASEMLNLCEAPIIEKTRYIVNFSGKRWEIDEFHGFLTGLTIAEIELTDSSDSFSLPPFIGEEVTDNPAYYNSNLTTSAIFARAE